MKVQILHTDVRVDPSFPVQLVVAVDDLVLRAELDWTTIESWMGPGHVTPEGVDEFLRHHRHGIERAIAAHLFAHGIPLAHRISMASEEFYDLGGEESAAEHHAAQASAPQRH
jgi:hypothetical protein